MTDDQPNLFEVISEVTGNRNEEVSGPPARIPSSIVSTALIAKQRKRLTVVYVDCYVRLPTPRAPRHHQAPTHPRPASHARSRTQRP